MFESRPSRASIDPLLPSTGNLLSTATPTITSYRASGYLQPVTNQIYTTSPALGRASISPKVESTTAYVDQVIAKSRASRIEAERQRQSGIGLDLLQPQGNLGRASQFGISQFGASSGNVITSYVETESRFETSKNLGPSILDKPLTQTNYYTSSSGLGGGLYNDKSLSYGAGTYSGYDNLGNGLTSTISTTNTVVGSSSSEGKKHKKDLQGVILLMAVEIERLKQNADSANYRVIELEQKYSNSQLREGQVADLNMRLREYESKISILEKENDSWKSRFFSLESESREYQRRLPNLEQELDSLRVRYNNKERELDEVRLRTENAKRSAPLDREIKDLTTKFLQEREYLESELRRKDAEIQDLRLRNNMKGSSDQELISLRELLRTREREIEKLRSQGGGSSSASEEKVAQLSMEIERLRNLNNQKNEDYEILNKRNKAQTDELNKLKAEHSRLLTNFNKLRKNNGGWCC